jgi:hypothetical protein
MKDFLKFIFGLIGICALIVGMGYVIFSIPTRSECECRYWRTAWDEHPVVINSKCELINGYVIAGSDTINPYKVSNICKQ